MNEMLNTLGKNARNAEVLVRNLSANEKNEVLLKVAETLTENADTLTAANTLDVENGRKNNMPEALVDRLLLTGDRIRGMAEGLRQVAALEDPVGEVPWNEEASQWSDDRAEKSAFRCDRNYL